MIKNEQLELFPELINYIYESPDKGKTIYRRKFGDTHKEKGIIWSYRMSIIKIVDSLELFVAVWRRTFRRY